MKQVLGLMGLGLLAFSSCGPKQFYERTETGLVYYFFEKNHTGKTGEKGDIYNLNITATNMKDSVIFHREAMFERSAPIYPGDFHEGLSMLHEDDSAALVLHVDSFFTMHGLSIPRVLQKDSMFRLHVGVEAILNPFEHTIYKSEQEIKEMKRFAERKNWNAKTDSTGIMFEITQANPEGETIAIDDSVRMSYIYATLDDRVIDMTKEGDSWGFRVGSLQTRVNGLSRLLTLMRDGEKARAIIPFTEAFGEEGFGVLVPPYATLVMVVEAEKVKE